MTLTSDILSSVVYASSASSYKCEIPPDDTKMNKIPTLPSPVTDADLSRQLDSPLSLEDASNSIKARKSEKPSGPDGFPFEFFKNIYWLIGTATFIRIQRILGKWLITTDFDRNQIPSLV